MMIKTSKNKYPFSDRKDILQRLEGYLGEIKEGNGRLVLLRGEAGVGKTAVAEIFLETCREEGFTILRGRSLYYESHSPFLPFLDAFEDHLEEREKSSEGSSSWTSSMSMVGVSGLKEERPTISISNKRDQMFENFTELIADISSDNPLIIFLDDIQWIDQSSAQLLSHLIPDIGDNRVLLLGAFRPEELSASDVELPFETFLDKYSSQEITDIIELERMGFEELSEMVEGILETEDIPEKFLLNLYDESEGNPFYVVEILSSLESEGRIDPYSFRWDPETELSDISIPKTIQDISNRRLDRLSRKEKNILLYASVIGTEFDFELLEKTVDTDVNELLDIMERLEQHMIIHEKEDSPGEIFRFEHHQTRRMIYNNMGRSRKRVLHSRVGEMMEDHYEESLEEHYPYLSLHFYKGNNFEKAYDYSLKSAENAISNFAIGDAINFYDRALDSLRRTQDIDDPESKEIDLLRKLGDLNFESSEWERSTEYYEELEELGEERGDKELEALSLRKRGDALKELQEHEEAKDLYLKALSINEEIEEQREIAFCHRGLGYIYWREGDFDEAIEHYERSVDEGKGVQDKKVLAATYLEIGNIYAQRGLCDMAIQYYKRSIPQLKSRKAFRELARAYNNMGDQYMKKDDYEKALKYFDRSIETGEKIGSKKFIGWGNFNRGQALAKKGEIDKAERYVKRAEKILRSIDSSMGLAAVYRTFGMLKRMDEDFEGAEEEIKKGLDLLEGLDIPFNEALCEYELGKVYLDSGESAKAKEHLESALEVFRELESVHYTENTEELLEKVEDE